MEKETTLLTQALQKDLSLVPLPNSSFEQLRSYLASHINHLINHDFEKLVFYLYRIDVDEARMRALLAHKEGNDAPVLIADLIIERQLQKIKSRTASAKDEDIPDEERW